LQTQGLSKEVILNEFGLKMFLNNTIPHHQLLQNMSSKAQLEAQLMITGPKRTVAIWAVLQPNQHA
jgi:hypothetical protein